jgi:hypothetical protein
MFLCVFVSTFTCIFSKTRMSDTSEVEIYHEETNATAETLTNAQPIATGAESNNYETHVKYPWFKVIEYKRATRRGVYRCTLCAKLIKTSHGWSDVYVLFRNLSFRIGSTYNLVQHTKCTHVGHWTTYTKRLSDEHEKQPTTTTRTLDNFNFVASHSDALHLSLIHQLIGSNLSFAYVEHDSTIAHYQLVAPNFVLKTRTWYQQVHAIFFFF